MLRQPEKFVELLDSSDLDCCRSASLALGTYLRLIDFKAHSDLRLIDNKKTAAALPPSPSVTFVY